MGQYCCRSKRAPKAEQQAKRQPETQLIEVKDYIHVCKFESGFKQYLDTNFELKNMSKYLLIEQGGIFTLDLIIKVFMASFVWKNIIFDHMQRPII